MQAPAPRPHRIYSPPPTSTPGTSAVTGSESPFVRHRGPPDTVTKPPRILHGPQGQVFLCYELLGHGASSNCYRVEELNRREYALKVVPRKLLVSNLACRNLTREVLINTHIQHSRLVAFRMHFHDAYNVYLCLEFCANGSLSQLIKSRRGLTETEACYFAANIALGLEFLHENLIVHRDIKPGNVLIDQSMQPKIADFGLALVLPNKSAVISSFAGTPCYLAPEVILKPRKYGMGADIWSLGTLMYTMVFGRSPFAANRTSKIYQLVCQGDIYFSSHRNISLEFCTLICNLLNREPSMRPNLRTLLFDEWVQNHFVSSLPSSVMVTPFESKATDTKAQLEQFLDQHPPPSYTASKLFIDYVSKNLQDSTAPSPPISLGRPGEPKPPSAS